MWSLTLPRSRSTPSSPVAVLNEEALKELASSIRELGVIQPITVRKLSFGKYQLVSGERRFRASKIVGLQKIPSYIRIANDQESLEMALVENIQREDLDPIEIALSYQRLIDEINLTQEQMSDRVGKNRSTIANYLRLLKLDPIIQTGMRDGFLSMGHGRALINIENTGDQLDIYEKIIGNSLSVRATETLVKNYKADGNTEVSSARPKIPDFMKKGKKEIATYFGAKVDVKVAKKGNGRLIIPFSSEEDFKRIQKTDSRCGIIALFS